MVGRLTLAKGATLCFVFFSIDAQSLTSALLGPIRSASVQNVPRVSTKVCLTLVCLSFTTGACKSLYYFLLVF